jgi:tetratricopeptide (TPR) repeat protein
MRKINNLQSSLGLLLAIAIQGIDATAEPMQPVDTKGSMRNIFSAYRELQPYLIKSEKFFDESNRVKIEGLINEINNGFHSVDKIDEKFKKQPGFATNIQLVRETLTQVSKDMKTDPSEYDLLRLKAISQNCLSCHSTYQPESKFESIVPPEIEGDLIAKANYLAATRQFKEAEETYYEAALKAAPGSQILTPLRYWLVVETRINEEPVHAINRLESLLKARKDILIFEKGEIQSWLDGLNRWKRDAVTLPPLKKAEFLLRQTINSPEPAYSRTPEVEVLRASGILHRAFAANTISASDRGQALYILGLSYSKLPLFFPDELPEFYLESCVRENPNTTVARSAYSLFKEMLTLGYTGSGGTHIPGDVLAKIDELYRIAHGIPDIKEQI